MSLRQLASRYMICCIFLLLTTALSTAAEQAAPLQAVLIRGNVINADGTPAADGTIDISAMAERNVGIELIVQNGKFNRNSAGTNVAIPPGDYAVTFRSRDLTSFAFRVVQFTTEQNTAEFTLRLGDYPMHVLSTTMPAGIPNAAVELKGPIVGGRQFRERLFTGPDGTCHFSVPEVKNWSVSIQAPYHEPTGWIELASIAREPKVRLAPEELVMGKILDGLGYPVSGSKVMLRAKDLLLQTDADNYGTFSVLHDLKPGDYTIEAHAPYYLPARLNFTLVENQQLIGLGVRLERTRRQVIGGLVTASDGKTPLAGGQVIFSQHFSPPPPPGDKPPYVPNVGPGGIEIAYDATTDQNGRFSLELPVPVKYPQRWQVKVSAPSYLERRYAAIDTGEDSLKGFHFELWHGGRLQGQLISFTEPGNQRMARAELFISTPVANDPGKFSGFRRTTAKIDPTGKFDFGSLQPGEHLLYIHIPGKQVIRQKVTVKEGETTEVKLQLPSGTE